jgi:hypothetical protein
MYKYPKYIIFYHLQKRSTSDIFNKRSNKMAEIAYCVKCKAKTEMKDAQKVTMKNGRPAMKGTCTKCGTGMYKILPSK